MKPFRPFLAFFLSSLVPSAFTQQMPAYTEAGPVPAAFTSAKTIFVSNGGADSGLFPERLPFNSGVFSQPFTGDAARPYTEFYAALQATKEYTLVNDPNKADIVLELRLTAPYGSATATPNRQNGASDPLPQFRLVVYDAKSHYILWTFTESIEPAILQKTHDKNLDLAALLRQFLTIAHRPKAAPPMPAQ